MLRLVSVRNGPLTRRYWLTQGKIFDIYSLLLHGILHVLARASVDTSIRRISSALVAMTAIVQSLTLPTLYIDSVSLWPEQSAKCDCATSMSMYMMHCQLAYQGTRLSG